MIITETRRVRRFIGRMCLRVGALGKAFRIGILIAPGLLATVASGAAVNSPAARFFEQGVAAASAGEMHQAEAMFREAVALELSSGGLHNLGNAAWRVGERGPAVLAWERSLWLDPWHEPARQSLAHARHTANLGTPDLRWFEVCSTWLPHSWWPWLTMACFWSCVALLVLPPVLRWRRRDWAHALAAAFAAATLLCLPALAGLNGRARLGFVLPAQAPLRVTPTDAAHITSYISSGTPVRLQRTRGDYLLISTRYSEGWVRRAELGVIGE
jgi:hypothetical protein